MAPSFDTTTLTQQIHRWGQEHGFQQIGIASLCLDDASAQLKQWLDRGFHGEMAYMARNTDKRAAPEKLVPGTVSIISVRMDYLTETTDPSSVLSNHHLGYISRYALGRDYHKLIRKRLKLFAEKIKAHVGTLGYRVFTDSAPVFEKALAQNANLGWIGKHTNLINRDAGSWFFLGEIFIDLALPPAHTENKNHCGRCDKCIRICPTQAIVAPYQLDARRCISYLTIELRGSIPEEFRPLIGNRIYGCDDCQLVCPWNRFAQYTTEVDFLPRNQFDAPDLLTLFSWSEDEFLRRTEGSPIRRIGYQCWLRNIAIALGNGPKTEAVKTALQHQRDNPSELVREHILWALSH